MSSNNNELVRGGGGSGGSRGGGSSGGNENDPFSSGASTERVNNPRRFGEIEAVVGPIEFVSGLTDPDVNITTERETADHEIVSGHSAYRDNNAEYVVQALGRRPTEIEITGWITSEQLDYADNLVSEDRINVITARWTGIAVPERVNVDYSRTFHDEHGWIFETDIELFGVAENRLLED